VLWRPNQKMNMMDFMERMEVIRGDITKLNVDAIVNAANSSLLGGGGVDGAIHRAAGPQLLEECRKLGGCETGKAKATKGYRLPARYVFHAVGPIWHGGTHGEAELLASCYRECMKLAKEYGVKTIAFPAISCGVYHFPAEQAAEIAIRTLKECLQDNPQIEKIYLVCFDDKVYQAYQDALSKFQQENIAKQ